MGALAIAFDTTIVGALALPWIVLFVHLFYFEGENRIYQLLHWIKQQQLTAVAGVILFAVAYTLGSGVSRIAQDFFNDNDLFVHVGRHLFRDGTTEDHIIAKVYCDGYDGNLLAAGGNPPLLRKIGTFAYEKSVACKKGDSLPQAADANGGGQNACLCEEILKWKLIRGHSNRGSAKPDASAGNAAQDLPFAEEDDESKEDEFSQTAVDIFGVEENELLLKGEDNTERLRQFHDQIMVLRGAAFNGLVATAFCLFAWGANVRRDQPRSWLRWILALVPLVLLLVGWNSIRHHLAERSPSDPPYMEFSVIVTGCAGAWFLWRPLHHRRLGEKCRWPRWRWTGLVVLSCVLTTAAILGWWATEVIYAQQVIYAYDSQIPAAAKSDAGK